jgi:ribosomal protein L13E
MSEQRREPGDSIAQIELREVKRDRDFWVKKHEILRKQVSAIRDISIQLIDYRRRNTLNFQLEKMDDYIRQLENAISVIGEA